MSERASVEARVEQALLRVAENVAKHVIQRSGWEKSDACFQVDLRQSVEEIMAIIEESKEGK